MLARVTQQLYFVVRHAFRPNYDGHWADVELLRSCVLTTGEDSHYAEVFDRKGQWEPLRCTVEHSRRTFGMSDTFRHNHPSFSYHVWGPYSVETYQRGLWLFRGTVSPDDVKCFLQAAGCPESFILEDDVRCDIVRQENFAAITGQALLVINEGRFVIAPVVDLSKVLQSS